MTWIVILFLNRELRLVWNSANCCVYHSIRFRVGVRHVAGALNVIHKFLWRAAFEFMTLSTARSQIPPHLSERWSADRWSLLSRMLCVAWFMGICDLCVDHSYRSLPVIFSCCTIGNVCLGWRAISMTTRNRKTEKWSCKHYQSVAW